MRKFARVIISIQLIFTCVVAQESVSFNVTDLDGQTAEFAHRFSVYLTSDRGDELGFPGPEVNIEILGSWKSIEKRTQTDSGYVEVTATIKEGDSWAKQVGQKLTFEQYPFSFGQLDNKVFKSRLYPFKGGSQIEPTFRVWQVRQRTDIVNDIIMLWTAGLLPAMPEGDVSVGDSWTGESDLERRFYMLGSRDKKFRLALKSTYKVKKIKNKGGKQIVEIEEKREFDYSSMVETVPFTAVIVGSGTGTAGWEIDATSGVVNKCQYTMDVNRPSIQPDGASRLVSDIDSNLKIIYDVQLKKLKK
jgi:hypothetical protein